MPTQKLQQHPFCKKRLTARFCKPSFPVTTAITTPRQRRAEFKYLESMTYLFNLTKYEASNFFVDSG